MEPLKLDIIVNTNQAKKSLDAFATDTGKKYKVEIAVWLKQNIAEMQQQMKALQKQLKWATWKQEIELLIKKNELSSTITESKRQLKNLETQWDITTSRLQAKFNKLWSGVKWIFAKLWWYLAWIFAVQKIWQFFSSAIQEAKDAERSIAQMNSAIKATWWVVWLSWKQIRDMATELSQLTWIEDDVIMSSQNMLLTFKNIRWDTFKETTTAVLDMATAMNNWLTPSAEQLSSSSIRLWKALNDPTKWISALTKVWVSFTEEQKKQITNFQKWWELAKAQAIILAELNSEFGGSAQAQMETYWGKVLALNTQRASFKEQIGNLIIPILLSLIWVISKVIDWISKFVSIFDSSAKSMWELNKQFEDWIISISKYIEKKWELTGKIKENRIALDKLNQEYIMWKINMIDYISETDRLNKEYDKLIWKTEDTTIATDTLMMQIETFYNAKPTTKAQREELEKLRKQILSVIDANIALVESAIYVKQAQTLQWEWAVAPMYWELIENIKIAWDESTNLTKKLESLKSKRKEIETAQKANIKDLDNEAWAIWWVWKSADKLKQTFKDTFTSIDKDIDWSKKKIDEYSDSVKELSWQLDDLQSDIASRVLEIDQALSATWEDTVSWDERAKLEAERAEAFIWLTEAETQALKDKIAEQDAYNKLSEIWKLKADFLKETWFTQEQAENELKIREEQLKSEEELYKQLNDAKIALERDYTTKFKEFINEQNIAVQELQNKIYSTMWLMKSAQWTVSSISNVNNTTNKNTTIWTVVITKPTATLWDNLSQ